MFDQKKLTTVAGGWKQLEEYCWRGKSISDYQRTECRKFFYAGAALMLKLVTDVADSGDSPAHVEAGAKKIKALNEEMLQYALSLAAEFGADITAQATILRAKHG